MLLLALVLSTQAEAFSRDGFERHILKLAADDMKGRDAGTPEGLAAAQYVADRFKESGLKPGGKDGYFQDFTARFSSGSPEHRGRNVVGLLEGKRLKEFVVVAAHHDGLGVRNGKVHNGADDNASGVAMVLELARSFAGTVPGRSMLFISFDCEEDGLLGSREFVKSELYPASSFAALFVFDLVGGDFFEWEKDRFYALGSESSAELYERVGNCATKAGTLEVVRNGVFLIEPFPDMARSDYQAFRGREVPFVFFSTGTPWYYHTEHDDPGIINYDKMVRAARFVRRVVSETAEDEKRPVFRRAEVREEDRAAMMDALRKAWELREKLKITDAQKESLERLLKEVAEPKEPDRKKLQQAMILLFTIARAQTKP